MTSPISEKPATGRSDTGSSNARHVHGKGVVRTCLPAFLDERTTRSALRDTEWNIVRGED
ncbi:hypothetical protein [Streptomyces sp. NPDC001286]